jgi:hypothetical protein
MKGWNPREERACRLTPRFDKRSPGRAFRELQSAALNLQPQRPATLTSCPRIAAESAVEIACICSSVK